MHWARMLASGRLLAGLPVDPGEHPAEQVGGVGGVALRAAFDDELVDHVVHEGLVLLELPLGANLQPGLDRQLADARLGLGEDAHHRLDEGVGGVAVEGVEPVPEAAERDRVQGQPGHVGRYVDVLAGVQPLPLVHELVGDVEHPRHVVTHRLQAERGHQDVVRPAPQRVMRCPR